MNSDLSRAKQMAREFFDLANKDGLEAAVAILPDDCIWWNAKTVTDREGILEVARSVTQQLAEPLSFTILTMTAEDDRVAVEAQSSALLTNGSRYANQYHFLFFLRGDEIARVNEHCDTDHAVSIFGALA